MAIPNRLKEVRTEKGLTLTQAAEQVGSTTATSLARYEKSTVGVPDPMKIRLARFYGVPVSELWDWR